MVLVIIDLLLGKPVLNHLHIIERVGKAILYLMLDSIVILGLSSSKLT